MYKTPGLIGLTLGIGIGALAGMMLGVLFAPRKGEETRAQIRNKVHEARAKTMEQLNQKKTAAQDKANQAVAKTEDKVAQATNSDSTPR